MHNEMIQAYLSQGSLGLAVTLPKAVADKMGELRSRDPLRWEDKDLDLLDEAERQLGITHPEEE